jgi:hypothetical protein
VKTFETDVQWTSQKTCETGPHRGPRKQKRGDNMATRKEIKAVMKQAAKYRKEGMSNHEALVKAWEGHKGKKERRSK